MEWVPLRSLPCIHEGAVLEWCTTCQGDGKHVRDCDVHERCTRGLVSEKVRSCTTCADYQSPAVRVVAPLRTIHVPSDQLGRGTSTMYASKVRASQQNGSGPAIAPVTAPFSFGQFATGVRAKFGKR